MTEAEQLRRIGVVAGLGGVALVVLLTVVREPSFTVTVLTDAVRWAFGSRLSPGEAERLVAAAANVLLFVPMGAGGVLLAGRRRLALVLGACLALSVGVEVAQGLWLPRDAQISDVVLNTVGAGLGCAVVAVIRSKREAGSGEGGPTDREP